MNNLQLKLRKDHRIFITEECPYTTKNKFAFVYDPVKEGEIDLTEWVESCREVVCDRIRTALSNKKTFDIKKLRLITHAKFLPRGDNMRLTKMQKNSIEKKAAQYKKEMLVSIKIINMLEKEFKWPLTKIYSAECKEINENNAFYYFEGSKRWAKSPSLLSLFMLLIRVSSSLKKHTEFRTPDGFYRSLSKNQNSTDVSYLKTHYKRWILAMRRYDRLFGKTHARELYIPDSSADLGQFAEGINSLCDLDTTNLRLRKKFTKIVEEENMLNPWEKTKLMNFRKNKGKD